MRRRNSAPSRPKRAEAAKASPDTADAIVAHFRQDIHDLPAGPVSGFCRSVEIDPMLHRLALERGGSVFSRLSGTRCTACFPRMDTRWRDGAGHTVSGSRGFCGSDGSVVLWCRAGIRPAWIPFGVRGGYYDHRAGCTSRAKSDNGRWYCLFCARVDAVPVAEYDHPWLDRDRTRSYRDWSLDYADTFLRRFGWPGGDVVVEHLPRLREEWKLVRCRHGRTRHMVSASRKNPRVSFRPGPTVTGGNHSWDKPDIAPYSGPADAARSISGRHTRPGAAEFTTGSGEVKVINVMCRLLWNFGRPLRVEQELAPPKPGGCRRHRRLSMAATSEKAMGHLADGKASLVVGSHTHVPTGDAC